jgi:hypothetical protein
VITLSSKIVLNSENREAICYLNGPLEVKKIIRQFKSIERALRLYTKMTGPWGLCKKIAEEEKNKKKKYTRELILNISEEMDQLFEEFDRG